MDTDTLFRALVGALAGDASALRWIRANEAQVKAVIQEEMRARRPAERPTLDLLRDAFARYARTDDGVDYLYALTTYAEKHPHDVPNNLKNAAVAIIYAVTDWEHPVPLSLSVILRSLSMAQVAALLDKIAPYAFDERPRYMETLAVRELAKIHPAKQWGAEIFDFPEVKSHFRPTKDVLRALLRAPQSEIKQTAEQLLNRLDLSEPHGLGKYRDAIMDLSPTALAQMVQQFAAAMMAHATSEEWQGHFAHYFKGKKGDRGQGKRRLDENMPAHMIEDARHRYTTLEGARAWIASAPHLRDRLYRAVRGLDIVQNPQGMFGITHVPSAVIDFYKRAVADAREEARPIRDRIEEASREHGAWDTAWAVAGSAGFSSGDSTLLGVLTSP